MMDTANQHLDIVGLGMTTLDVLLRTETLPTWQQTGQLTMISVDGGGPAGTACVAAARLGAGVGFVGTAGSDELAEMKVRSLRDNGVDVSRLVVRNAPEGQIIVVYVDDRTGERTFSGLRRELRGEPLRVDELDRSYIASARILHLDGHHTEAALQAAQWVHEAGGQVSLDGARMPQGHRLPPHLARLTPHADILICGAGFGEALTGYSDVQGAGEALLAMGPAIVVQTLGADGSYTSTASEFFHTPAFTVDVVDTTGAGDVFHGAYLVGLLRGWDLHTTARFAAAAAALKCTRVGGRRGIPALDDVMSLIGR